MEYQQNTRQARRDAQSVEIALALFTGVGVFVGLIVTVLVLAHLTGLVGADWGPVGPVGLVLAAIVGLGAMIGVLVRARRRGI